MPELGGISVLEEGIGVDNFCWEKTFWQIYYAC